MGRLAVILLSRQSLRPTANTEWVASTIRAVKWVKENDCTLATSIGMQTWELITALGSIHRVPLNIFIPAASRAAFDQTCLDTTREFDLDADRTEYTPVMPDQRHTDNDDLRKRRDEAIMEAADLVIPVSIRNDGRMGSLLNESATCTDRQFQVDYAARRPALAYRLDEADLNPELKSFANGRLIHWTRAVNGPWPGERKLDFYSELVTSSSWPRRAFDTLRRIVLMKCIIASDRNMPGKRRTVSFSALSPTEVAPLMRWRARYAHMSFEPYGIGIDEEWAMAHGVRAVCYYSGTSSEISEDTPGWLCQSIGKVTDWRAEREYRHQGDFSLTNIPKEKIILLCRYREEATLLEGEFAIRTIPFIG
jgi:hypothetical protein